MIPKLEILEKVVTLFDLHSTISIPLVQYEIELSYRETKYAIMTLLALDVIEEDGQNGYTKTDKEVNLSELYNVSPLIRMLSQYNRVEIQFCQRFLKTAPIRVRRLTNINRFREGFLDELRSSRLLIITGHYKIETKLSREERIEAIKYIDERMRFFKEIDGDDEENDEGNDEEYDEDCFRLPRELRFDDTEEEQTEETDDDEEDFSPISEDSMFDNDEEEETEETDDEDVSPIPDYLRFDKEEIEETDDEEEEETYDEDILSIPDYWKFENDEETEDEGPDEEGKKTYKSDALFPKFFTEYKKSEKERMTAKEMHEALCKTYEEGKGEIFRLPKSTSESSDVDDKSMLSSITSSYYSKLYNKKNQQTGESFDLKTFLEEYNKQAEKIEKQKGGSIFINEKGSLTAKIKRGELCLKLSLGYCGSCYLEEDGSLFPYLVKLFSERGDNLLKLIEIITPLYGVHVSHERHFMVFVDNPSDLVQSYYQLYDCITALTDIGMIVRQLKIHDAF